MDADPDKWHLSHSPVSPAQITCLRLYAFSDNVNNPVSTASLLGLVNAMESHWKQWLASLDHTCQFLVVILVSQNHVDIRILSSTILVVIRHRVMIVIE